MSYLKRSKHCTFDQRQIYLFCLDDILDLRGTGGPVTVLPHAYNSLEINLANHRQEIVMGSRKCWRPHIIYFMTGIS